MSSPWESVEENLSWIITIDSPEWRSFLNMKADADALLAVVRALEEQASWFGGVNDSKFSPKVNEALDALPEHLKGCNNE